MPIVSMFWKTYASGGAVPSRSAATKSPSCTCGCATPCSTWSHSPARKVAADAGDGGPARSTPSLGKPPPLLGHEGELVGVERRGDPLGGFGELVGEAKRDPVATEAVEQQLPVPKRHRCLPPWFASKAADDQWGVRTSAALRDLPEAEGSGIYRGHRAVRGGVRRVVPPPSQRLGAGPVDSWRGRVPIIHCSDGAGAGHARVEQQQRRQQ